MVLAGDLKGFIQSFMIYKRVYRILYGGGAF